MNPRIKICGIRQVEHARAAIDAGAAAIGLNFYPQSKRFIDSLDEARALRDEFKDSTIAWAGVFVNPSMEVLIDTAQALDLAVVQLHGDETPQFVSAAKMCLPESVEVWKAFRVSTEDDLQSIATYRGDAVVLDTKVGSELGGTGQTFDWKILKRFVRNVPLVLSGGLNPANVRAAILAVQPDWVDVASGVEDSPGQKSAALIREFIAAVGTPE